MMKKKKVNDGDGGKKVAQMDKGTVKKKQGKEKRNCLS